MRMHRTTVHIQQRALGELKPVPTPGVRLDPDADTWTVAMELPPSVFRYLDGTLVPTQDISPFLAGVFLPDLHAFPPKRHQWVRIRDKVGRTHPSSPIDSTTAHPSWKSSPTLTQPIQLGWSQ